MVHFTAKSQYRLIEYTQFAATNRLHESCFYANQLSSARVILILSWGGGEITKSIHESELWDNSNLYDQGSCHLDVEPNRLGREGDNNNGDIGNKMERQVSPNFDLKNRQFVPLFTAHTVNEEVLRRRR